MPVVQGEGIHKRFGAVTAVDKTQQVYRQAGRGDHIAFAATDVEIPMASASN